MLEFKKSELEGILFSISTYNQNPDGSTTLISGLLKEEITLGTRRRLQKIHKKTHEFYQEMKSQLLEIQDKCKEDEEKLKTEIEILANETVKVDAEPISMSLIENISSETNYNFEIIEKFAI